MKAVLLAGGRSTRMKTDKALLRCPNGKPLYEQMLHLINGVGPALDGIYISIRTEQIEHIDLSTLDFPVEILLDDVSADEVASAERSSMISGGPAVGLEAAYRSDPTSTWLVCACDQPLMSREAFHLLLKNFKSPVTCFQNDKGYLEPLVGVWDPAALERLLLNVKNGQESPSKVIRELHGCVIAPFDATCLQGANDPAEWEACLSVLRSRHTQTAGV